MLKRQCRYIYVILSIILLIAFTYREEVVSMTNKYCNLDGTKKIKDEFGKINEGFNKVDIDVSSIITGQDLDPNKDIEVLNARGTESTLGNRLNKIEISKADKTYVDTQISNIGDGSPKGSYATLAELQSAYPSGDTGIYIVTADGKWYYWSGSTWTAGGVYQSTGIADGSITSEKLAFAEYTKNMFDISAATDGYYINAPGNELIALQTYLTSDFIKIKQGVTYCITYVRKFTMFDDSKSLYVAGGGDINPGVYGYTFTAPIDGYVRFSYPKAMAPGGTMMVVGDTLPTEYIPYGYELKGLKDDTPNLIKNNNKEYMKVNYINKSNIQLEKVDTLYNYPIPQEDTYKMYGLGEGVNHNQSILITTPEFIEGVKETRKFTIGAWLNKKDFLDMTKFSGNKEVGLYFIAYDAGGQLLSASNNYYFTQDNWNAATVDYTYADIDSKFTHRVAAEYGDWIFIEAFIDFYDNAQSLADLGSIKVYYRMRNCPADEYVRWSPMMALITDEINPFIQYPKYHGESRVGDNSVKTESIIDGAVTTEKLDPSLANSLSGSGDMVFTKQGNVFQSRASWSDTEDIITRMTHNNSMQNLGFNMIGMYIVNNTTDKGDVTTGSTFKSCGDDITPMSINQGHIGGNHGWGGAINITSTAHGKTEVDIGSVWQDGATNNFIILKIIDDDNLLVMTEVMTNSYDPLINSVVSPLNHISGATHTSNISINSYSSTQLWPSVNNEEIEILINGKTKWNLDKDGYTLCDFFDVSQGYNIIYLPAIVNHLKANAGSNTNQSYYSDEIKDRYCRVNIVYRFTKNGACSVYQSVSFDKDVSMNYLGFVQSMAIGNKAYIPGTTAYSDVITQPDGAGLDFTQNIWVDPQNPPHRYYQFTTDMARGMCLGYNTQYGIGVPSERILHLDHAGAYAGSSKKMYPYILVDNYIATAGSYFDAVAYRIPLKQYQDLTSLAWYWIGDDIYLMIDAHKNLNKWIELPDYMTGMKIEVLEIHENAKVKQSFVMKDGVLFTVNNNYGYAVLKLTN